ncbi:hypothetical protein [Vibrio parahaemolyticus]|uniref:hypothetical protein n=2 Tax=Vibrio parahaemolyticus TaxID=670 RepID=UPI0003A93FA2|nr:hypothetical protein [Vibrio parahaemolyticus]MBE4074644.1 hypothetical protein [Vibrio parahaemolyticus]MCZ5860001.1 hypothetical protein [Vibrio parahaemolyticus]MCZ6297485.1 hypothetical protein [Vibrio parahaemolyticus]MDF4619769.1 hypothetical protein [Vibrio parahaemolyticus]MDF5494777.1 hypothetical protein [Vibrio parahaemolyticus]
MKKLTLILMLLITSNAYANWDINQNGVAIQQAQMGALAAAILEYTDGIYSVSIVDGTQLQMGAKCEEVQAVREVNGTPIKLYLACENGMQRIYGMTSKGREFILNEFKTKNSVTIGNTEFSAVGFSSALHELKKRKEWEKNAL